MDDNTPNDYAAPDWATAGRVHDWKRHVSQEVRAMWGDFTDRQRAALARQAEDAAEREEWD